MHFQLPEFLRFDMKKKGRILLISFAVILFVTAIASLLGEWSIPNIFSLQRKVVEIESENKVLKDDIAHLNRRINSLKKNPQEYEAIARQRLHMKEKGEKVIYLIKQ